MSWTILNADSHHIPLADNSVQCVVTSPPYWGLRDYGTATWVGGDEGCDHLQDRHPAGAMRNEGRNRAASNGTFHDSPRIESILSIQYRNVCGKCGATRIDSQIGLEKTPQEYVLKIISVFREVWRVLRDDGTCWVNLGDSYTTGTGRNYEPAFQDGGAYRIGMKQEAARYKPKDIGLKPKDLVGIPWRVAFALQAAGWYLRSDIIWSKPNPMPESVTDRPTKAHEYIFLLSKKERYFFDQDAVREDSQDFTNKRTVNEDGSQQIRKAWTDHKDRDDKKDLASWGSKYGSLVPANGRNIRTVWEIATQPYPEAHFATFPEEIAIRCIKAGTSEKGACAECGAPWVRVTETTYQNGGNGGPMSRIGTAIIDPATRSGSWFDERKTRHDKITGWQSTCKHEAGTVPCIVLDPFSGAGTVPLVADKLNRRGIGLELKWDYVRMAKNRCYDDAPLLAAMEG